MRENLRISRTSLEILNSFELIITTSTMQSDCMSQRERGAVRLQISERHGKGSERESWRAT